MDLKNKEHIKGYIISEINKTYETIMYINIQWGYPNLFNDKFNDNHKTI